MKLFVDVLNFCPKLFKSPENLQDCKSGMNKLNAFAQALKHYQVFIFLDGNKISETEKLKYISRMKRKRNLPFGIEMLIHDGFSKNNCKVIAPLDQDLDGFLLKSAREHDAFILSRDLFFRKHYGKVLDFNFLTNSLVCEPITGRIAPSICIPSTHSVNYSNDLALTQIHLHQSVGSVKFRKLLVMKQLHIPHENSLQRLRELRQALYFKLDLDSVLENDSNYVSKNGKYLKELENPVLALQEFYSRLGMVGKEEEFMGFSMVLEICSWAKDGGKSFYDFLCRYWPWFSKNLAI